MLSPTEMEETGGGGEASRDDGRGLWRDCGGKVEREGGGKWRENGGIGSVLDPEY